MSYETEFPVSARVPGAIVELVRDKVLTDESWGNDICPHFEAILIGRTNDEPNTVIQLWSDYENPKDREYGPDAKRFRVLVLENEQEPEGAQTMFETDDVYGAIKTMMDTIKLYANGEKVDVQAVGRRFVAILEADGFFQPEQLEQIAINKVDLQDVCDATLMHEAFTSCQPAYYLKANESHAAGDWKQAWMAAQAIITLKYHPNTRHMADNPQGRCQFDDNLTCRVCGLGFPGYHEHTKDEDCTVNADFTCDVCGVFHGEGCALCGGHGFHKDGCADSDATPMVYPPDGHTCDDECRSNGCTERNK